MPRPPLYTGLLSELEQRLSSGVYPAGERLPSERELAAEFGVVHGTVHKALLALQQRHLVRARRGAGWTVLPHDQSATGSGDVLLVMRLTRANMDKPIFPALFYQLLEQHLAHQGRRLFHWHTNPIPDNLTLLRGLMEYPVSQIILHEGLWITPASRQEFWTMLRTLPRRIVVFGADNHTDRIFADRVGIDWLSGTSAAVNYLLRQGYRRLLFAGYEGVDWSDERKGGFLSELQRHHLWDMHRPPPCLPLSSPESFLNMSDSIPGQRVAKDLLAYLEKHPVDAVLCANDQIVEQVQTLAGSAKLPLLVGYDNTAWPATHQVSSVAINLRLLVDEVLRVLELPPISPPRFVTVPTMLIER